MQIIEKVDLRDVGNLTNDFITNLPSKYDRSIYIFMARFLFALEDFRNRNIDYRDFMTVWLNIGMKSFTRRETLPDDTVFMFREGFGPNFDIRIGLYDVHFNLTVFKNEFNGICFRGGIRSTKINETMSKKLVKLNRPTAQQKFGDMDELFSIMAKIASLNREEGLGTYHGSVLKWFDKSG